VAIGFVDSAGMTARVDAEANVNAGDTVTLVANPDKLHSFDAVSEQNIMNFENTTLANYGD
jgi:MOSC domain-containing protein YiiM